MNWPFKTKKLNSSQAATVWDNATVRDAEKNRHNYRPQDVAAQEAVRRALGVVHDCASKNARVCSSMPLRLMRRVDAAGTADRRAFAGKAVGPATRKALTTGSMGKNIAAFMEAGGEVEEVMNHPILELLARPTLGMIGIHASWYSFYFREICGKSYELIARDGDGVSELYPMPAQFVELQYDDDGHSGYVYGRSETNIAHLDIDDVLMLKFQPSRFNPYDAEGPLAGVLAEADLIVQNIMHDLAFVNRGNRPDSMLTVDGVVDPKQLDELERRINSKFGGAANGHKTYVASGKVAWTPFVWPEKELQSMLKIEHYEKRIRSAFGHTESMGDSNDSTYASALVGFSEQYMGAEIRPRLIADAAQKNELLLPLFGLDPVVYSFVYDDPVKRDEAVLADRTRADVAAGLLTINEARAERNIEAIDDPAADAIRVNGQTLEGLDSGGGFDLFGGGFSATPQGNDQEQDVKPQGQKIEETALNGAQIAQLVDLAAKVTLGELTTEGARGIAIAAFPGIPPEKINGIFDQLTQGVLTNPDDVKMAGKSKVRHATAMIFKGMHDDELPEWRRCGCETKDDDDIAADPLMQQVFRQYLKPMEDTFERVVRGIQDEIIASERESRPAELDALIEQAKENLREAKIDIVAMGVENTLEMANQDVDGMFDVVNTRALERLEQQTIRVAEDIAETTETMIRPAIRRGIENGLSIDEIASELEGLPAYRAERIARTEVQNAAQGARYETFTEVGVETVQWVTAPGASKSHQALADKVYFKGGKKGEQKLGKPFATPKDGKEFTRDIYHPPARPNCRCSIRAIFPED